MAFHQLTRFAKGNRLFGRTPRTRCSTGPGTLGQQVLPTNGTHQISHGHLLRWARTAENVAIMTGISRKNGTAGACSQNRAEEDQERFFEREITPVTLPDGTTVSTDDGPRPGTTYEKVSELQAGFSGRMAP